MTTTQRWAVYLVFLVIYTHTAQPCIIMLHCMFRGLQGGDGPEVGLPLLVP